MTEDTDTPTAEHLREAMVDRLREMGEIRDDRVAEAFRVVPRHRFIPGVSLEEAYAVENAVVLKRNEHGAAMSSVSASRIIATMLEQAALRPGHRVLEVGSGGYNAALLAELVAETGAVTTVDIDPDVVERARRCLADTGYSRVRVVLADAEAGVAAHAPFDRIIVTVGTWDLPPAWTDQLADDGSITAPLRLLGLTRTMALRRDGDHLVSSSVQMCGFVPMQGAGAHEAHLLRLRGNEVTLRFDDGHPGEGALPDGVLESVRAEAWSGVTVGWMEPFDTLHLWLMAAAQGSCLLAVDPELDTGVVAPQNRTGCPAVVENGNLAYFAIREIAENRHEFGAHAFGPDAAALAATMAKQVRVWDRDHRHGPGSRVMVYPAGTPDERLPTGRVIDKRHTRVVITWPQKRGSAAPLLRAKR